MLLQLETQTPPEFEVFCYSLFHAAHFASPGHGSATVRSAARSTFAYTAVVFGLRCRRTSPISSSDAPPPSRPVASVWRNRCAPVRSDLTPARASARLTIVETVVEPANPR